MIAWRRLARPNAQHMEINPPQKRHGWDLSGDEVTRIVSMLKEGREVDAESALDELPNCPIVTTIGDGEKIVSAAALKSVRKTYNESISENSGYRLPPGIPELGYVVTDAGHRKQGHARSVCLAVLKDLDGPLFATVRIDNRSMIVILECNGFVRVGDAWPSRKRKNVKLGLWIRNGNDSDATAFLPTVKREPP